MARLRRAAVAAAVLLAAAAGAPAAGAPVAAGSGGAVASVDADATRAGLEVLRAGGNAVDAAVAAGAALGVVEPYVAGLGGGGFVVVYLARPKRIVTIDGRETAPAGLPPDAFLDPATGAPVPLTPNRVTTGLAVGVPGTLAAWDLAARRFGTRPLAQLLRPAIRLAERGFVVDATFRGDTEANLERFRLFSPTRGLFLTPDGAAPPVGSRLRNPALARAYRLIARDGPSALYAGPIGAAIVGAASRPPLAAGAAPLFPVRPSPMTMADLGRYRALLRPPVTVHYRGFVVAGMGPPSSGGTTVGEALRILDGFRLGGSDRTLALHRLLEAERLAFADRGRFVGDPAVVRVPVAGLTAPGFAAERRCLIGHVALTSPIPPGDPSPPYASTCPLAAPSAAAAAEREGSATTHLTVADRWGNVVSYTQTLEQVGGSGIAVPGFGFLLNNELTDFDPAPAVAGQPSPNLPAPGARPRSSMSPTIVLSRGRPVLALGSPGGSTIITTVLQVLVNRFDFGMSLPAAVAAPRASQRNLPASTAEPAFIAAHGPALAALGHALAPVDAIGAVAAIALGGGGWLQAVAEPVRRGGGSAGVVCPSQRSGAARPCGG
jgi:gamma-glutamyltranspeptidase/glutathione hydrolase